MCHKNIAGSFFGLVTKHACDRQTGRRTDGQNYDSQDRASIAASRGKNETTGQDYDRTRNRGVRKRDVPTKPGRVATIIPGRAGLHDTAGCQTDLTTVLTTGCNV